MGSTTTRFVYDDQGRLLGEYDNAGKIIQETIWLEDLPVATLRPGLRSDDRQVCAERSDWA